MTAKPRIMLDSDCCTNAKVLELSSDAARWAWVVLLLKAKPRGGAFASEAQLREEMGSRYKYVAELRKVGFLDGLDIHDWPAHQHDLNGTARDRQKAYRSRKAGVMRDAVVAKGDVTRDVTRDGKNVTRNTPEQELVNPLTPLEGEPSLHRDTPQATWWDAYVAAYPAKARHRYATYADLVTRRVRDYGLPRCIAAIHGSKFDPWEGRAQNVEPKDILKPSNIDRFTLWATDPSSRPRVDSGERHLTAEEQDAYTERILAAERA